MLSTSISIVLLTDGNEWEGQEELLINNITLSLNLRILSFGRLEVWFSIIIPFVHEDTGEVKLAKPLHFGRY